MVPSGWNETKLGEVISHQKGFAFKSESYTTEGTRIIRISDTTRNSIHDKSPVYLKDDEAESLSNYKLKEDDIVLSTVGSRPHLLESMVGKAVKLRKQDNGALLNQNLVRVIPKPKLITNEYLFTMLTKSQFIYFISTLVRGNANQVSITLAELFAYNFVLPPYEEQRKIAKILSTWDKAISITERLIDNSRQQKKALMQQLLTGKKRLLDDSGKPFEGDWERKSFKEVLRLDRGSSPRPIINFVTKDSDGVNWIKIGDTKNDTSFITSTKEKISLEGAKKSRKVSTGEIIVSNSMSYGKPYILKIDGYIHDGWFVLRDYQKHMDATFLIQLLSSEFVQAQYKRLAAGGVVTNISSELVYAVKVNLPEISEQTKIAAVLLNADKESEILEQQLADLKQEKKALMQQLLTGKRIVKV
ncbi:MAG: type I restriction enzyme S subunit [Glaciecola sp.]|jgi:type I restriction enzyme S subunit